MRDLKGNNGVVRFDPQVFYANFITAIVKFVFIISLIVSLVYITYSSEANAQVNDYVVDRYVVCYTPLLKEYKVGRYGVRNIAITDGGLTIIEIEDTTKNISTRIVYSPGVACTHATIKRPNK